MNEPGFLFSFIISPQNPRYRAEFDMWKIAYHPANLYYFAKKQQQNKNGIQNFLS